MALEASGASGTRYRLDAATFEIVGPTTVTVSSEPDEEFIKVDLAEGAYTTSIQPGWQLVVVAADGTTSPIDATLVSASQVATPIVTGEQTEVRFEFDISGEIIPFGFGRANIGIGVLEGAEPEAVCGNGVVETDEACDDGNAVTETTCPQGQSSCTVCNADCSATVDVSNYVCGNGIREPGEVCDDGDGGSNDGCDASCQATPFLVNSPTAAVDTYAEVARAPDGRFIAVWSTADAVFMRRFDGLGNPLGAEVPLAQGFAPQVVVAPDFSAAVSWSSTMNGGSVQFARFTPAGTPNGSTRVVLTNMGASPASAVSLLPNNEGTFVVTSAAGLVLHQFNAANNLMGQTVVTQGGGSSNALRPAVVTDSTGRTTVVYDAAIANGRSIFYRRYNDGLTPVLPAPTQIAPIATNNINADVATRADGAFFISWQAAEGNHRPYAAGFTPGGSMIFTTAPLTQLDGRDHVETSITAGENGRVTVAWATLGNPPTIDASVLDAATGSPLGTLSVPGASLSYPSISVDQNGEYALVYRGTDVLGHLLGADGALLGVSTSVAP
jgi:cysteine-rich repeat protein